MADSNYSLINPLMNCIADSHSFVKLNSVPDDIETTDENKEVFAKLAINVTGSAEAVHPMMNCYADNRSYVKVDPSAVGISDPNGINELYAKVIYIPGLSESGSSSGSITVESDPLFSAMSGNFVIKDDFESAIKEIKNSVNSRLLRLEGLANVTTEFSERIYDDESSVETSDRINTNPTINYGER